MDEFDVVFTNGMADDTDADGAGDANAANAARSRKLVRHEK